MSSEVFRVVEHEVPCQYIREYPRATSTDQEDTLFLAVKQYIPLNNPNPQPGDITVIGAHANGFPKVRAVPTLNSVSYQHFPPLGTLRTHMGRDTCSLKESWLQDSIHLGR